MVKYRLWNEIRSNMYWEKEERRKCRMCGCESDSWEHVQEVCVDGRKKKLVRNEESYVRRE